MDTIIFYEILDLGIRAKIEEARKDYWKSILKLIEELRKQGFTDTDILEKISDLAKKSIYAVY